METITSHRTLDEIRALSYFSISLHQKNTIEEVLWSITQNIIQQFGFVDCVIYTFNKQEEVLIQKAAYGQKNPFEKLIYNRIQIPIGKGIVGCAAANKQAELIQNTKYDQRYIVDDAIRSSEISIPILIDNQLFGVIDCEHPEENFFTEKHIHLLTIVASLCSQKIKEIQLKSRKPFTKSNSYFKRFDSLLSQDKIYRNPYLTLSTAAEQLNISPSYLSTMVNSLYKKSFIDLINEYRVKDVKQHLFSMEFNNYTIVSLGLEAGFNSKSAFYEAFKKHTSMTPMQYKNKNLIEN